ncbi:hypothetical protein CF336_g8242 [Tilletia laevis]|nr:hypothetical protein CF336_g8242 [Tilletia laevis]
MPAISHLVRDLPRLTSTPDIPIALDARHLVGPLVDKPDARMVHPESRRDLVFIPYRAPLHDPHSASLTETSRSLASEEGDPAASRSSEDGRPDGDLKASRSVQEPHPSLVSVNKDFHPALVLLNRAEVPQPRSLQDEHPGRIMLSSEELSVLQQVHPRNVGSGSEHQQLAQRSWWKTSTTQPSNARNVEDLLTRHPSDSADLPELLRRQGELPSGAHPQARNLLVEASWGLMAGQIIGNVYKKGTLF